MYWLAVSSKLIWFVLNFSHKYLYHISIKHPIKKVVHRGVIYSLVSFLFFYNIHNILLVIISILLFYPFDHCHDSPVVIFHCILRFEKFSVSRMLSFCSAWMLTFKISRDATTSASDLGTLGNLCHCCPPYTVVIVMVVFLLLENRASHKIREVTALSEELHGLVLP